MANRKKTIEEIKYFIEVESDSGCKLLSTEYTHSSHKLLIECKCGNPFEKSWDAFRQNQRICNDCSATIHGSNVKHTIEEVKHFIEEESDSGCELLSLVYINITSKLKIKCKCGNPFKKSYYSFKNNNQRQCDECSIDIRAHLIEDIEVKVNNLGYELLTKEYKNNKQKLTLKDIEDYFYYIEYNSLINRGLTPERFCISNPYTLQNILLWVKNNNKEYELIDGQTYEGNNKKLKWKCLKEDCGEIFELAWNQIYSGTRCGFCEGRQVGISNCLATKFPEIAKEWHLTKNGNLTPYDVTCGLTNKVWWKCSVNPKHEWEASIGSRTTQNCGCPYCSHRFASEDYNLLITNPSVCEEWNYEKNENRPEDYTPHSGKLAYWKCNDCGNEWSIPICNRTKLVQPSGCPECSKSHGEKKCKEYFDAKDLYYIPQKEFDGLLGLGGGNLSYDFYLPNYNILLEYQGIQHEKYVKGLHKNKKSFVKQQEHDRRKKEYAIQNGYNFLEIWYWDFDNIEIILEEYLSNYIVNK